MVSKEDRLAVFLYTPYIVWLLFASYLNLFIVLNNQINIPTINPVMQDANVAPTRAFRETLIRSSFRSGAIAAIPETKIPTEDKLAKPHKL